MSNEVDLRKQRKVEASVTLDSTGLATSDNQTNGNQKIQIVDTGGEAATVTGGKLDVNASIDTTGLSTEAKQDTIILELQDINNNIDEVETKLDNIILVENSILSELQDINKHVDNESKGVVAASITSVLIKSANTTRKSLRIRNLNTKKMCISFVSPATLNDAIYLNRDEIWIEEENFGNIYGIWDTGATGNGCTYEEIFE